MQIFLVYAALSGGKVNVFFIFKSADMYFLFAVFTWRYVEMGLENFAEISHIIKTAFFCNFFNGKNTVFKKLLCQFDP